MKEFMKKSIIIYIIIPVIVALWPALVVGIYLPGAQNKLKTDLSDYNEADNVMLDILSLVPERTQPKDPNQENVEFSYYRVVPEIAQICNIPETKYKTNASARLDTKASNTQPATVTLTDVDITSFAKFLSLIQSHWPKLVCNSVKFTKANDAKDEWKITISFKYYFTDSD